MCHSTFYVQKQNFPPLNILILIWYTYDVPHKLIKIVAGKIEIKNWYTINTNYKGS